MSFSERMGITQPKLIQTTSLDTETRMSLWNICRATVFNYKSGTVLSKTSGIAVELYMYHYKLPVDDLPHQAYRFVSAQLEFFRKAPWYQVLDAIEFIANRVHSPASFRSAINAVLEREKSAFRFIADQLASLTNELEMAEVEAAAELADRFATIAEHIRAALECFSAKPSADYRNTVKEAISAVEAAAIIATGKPKATLGDALKLIEMHEAMKQSMSKLYGYTSDAGGIRHALTEESAVVDEAEARYMLVTCSACANFLISKIAT